MAILFQYEKDCGAVIYVKESLIVRSLIMKLKQQVIHLKNNSDERSKDDEGGNVYSVDVKKKGLILESNNKEFFVKMKSDKWRSITNNLYWLQHKKYGQEKIDVRELCLMLGD